MKVLHKWARRSEWSSDVDDTTELTVSWVGHFLHQVLMLPRHVVDREDVAITYHNRGGDCTPRTEGII
jgi:hypothetical protein